MPHFYFHLHNGRSRQEDARGISLPDAEAAWYQGYRSAREMVGQAGRDKQEWRNHALEVEDERGIHVWTMPLSELVELIT